MKLIAVLFSFFPILSCANVKDKNYTGSTPAGTVVRSFLSIPLTDSVDFIRWKLAINDNRYILECNYGIGKPNTNGFYDGGKKIELTGAIRKENNYYQLKNGNNVLMIAELNESLLHLSDENNNLLVGNGGWSYTLGDPGASPIDKVSINAGQTVLKDSIVFDGRTPCNIPGLIPTGEQCYKLKWRVVLFANPGESKPARYKIFGTRWRKEGSITGVMAIITGKDGRIIYQLNDENEKGFLYLLKLDENILVFTDAQGKLLVGDHDFSYTLNRKM